MARISLRKYIHEIESLIDQNRNDEAIEHCKHILEAYPKHIDTYRLLGKAFLESQKLSGAADIFQRVLSAIPDDFVSHLGMSIIREDEGNIDAAIWHMERAFEIQPYNTAVQGELKRLIGRRDGTEPPKVRLTRGALARMYAKGNLYDQAISELKKAIAEYPQRSDLLVVLADMYAKSGMKAEAIETCTRILDKLPYCYTANRILVDLLKNTDRAKDAIVYKKRIVALNPYEAFVNENTPKVEDVPDDAVTLHKLEWSGESVFTEALDNLSWMASQEEQEPINQVFDEENIPDWLKPLTEASTESEQQPSPEIEATENDDFSFRWENNNQPESALESPSTGDDDIIPDWMKNAGWEPASQQEEANQTSQQIENEPEVEEPAELPDWLKNPTLEEEQEGASSDSRSTIPEWLGGEEEKKETSAEETLDLYTNEEEQETEKPFQEESGIQFEKSEDDLSNLFSTSEEISTEIPQEAIDGGEKLEAASVQPSTQSPQKGEGNFMDNSTNEGQEAEELPEWLDELNAELEEIEKDNKFSTQARESTPEGLIGIEVPPQNEEVSQPSEEQLKQVFTNDSDIPDWLQELDFEEDVEEEEAPPEVETIDFQTQHKEEYQPLEEKDSLQSEQLPDWVESLAKEAPEEIETPQQQNISESAIPFPEWLLEYAEPEDLENIQKELSTRTPTKVSQLEEKVLEEEIPQTQEEIPDWLAETLGEEVELGILEKDIVESADEQVSHKEDILPAQPVETLEEQSQPPQVESPPEETTQIIQPAETAEEEIEEKIPEWLETIQAEEQTTAPEQETAEEPVQAIPETPSWLEPSQEEEPSPEIPAPSETIEPTEEEIPEWLEKIQAEEQPTAPEQEPSEPAQAIPEPPSWLEPSQEETPSEESETKLEPEAWLESTEGQEETPIEEELTFAEGESTLPEWLKKYQSDIEEVQTEATIEESLEKPKVMPKAETAAIDMESQPLEKIEETGSSEETMGEWLQEALETERPSQTQEEEKEITKEIPTWMQEETPTIDEIPSSKSDTHEWMQETTPERTSDAKVPDWLQEIDIDEIETTTEEEAEEEIAITEISQIQKQESTGETAQEPPVDFEDTEAALAWLESLAEKQGASEEDLTTSTEERTTTPPEWIQKYIEEETSEAEEGVTIEKTLPHETEEEETVEEAKEIPAAENITATTEPPEIKTKEPAQWMPAEETPPEEMVPTQQIEETSEQLEQPTTEPEGVEPTSEESAYEPPTWVIKGEEPEEDPNKWLPTGILEEIKDTAQRHEKLDINSASLIELERLPGIGFRTAQNIISYRVAKGKFSSIEEIKQIPSIDEATFEILKTLTDVVVPTEEEEEQETIQETRILPVIEIKDPIEKYEKILAEGQSSLAEGKIEEGLEKIATVVKRGKYLSHIINLLETAADAYPQNINILQILGDAYMRAERLQEALETYSKAQNLLR